MASIKTIFTNIANAIREKKGTTTKYLPENMSTEISTIETGIDTSDATATPNDILLNKTAYANGEKIVGAIQTYNNEHENGYVQINALKKVLDTTKSSVSLFAYYKGTSVDDLIQYSDTENVTGIGEMFNECENLQTIPQLNTSNVKIMNRTFNKCSSLTTIPQLDTSKVIYMNSTFFNCSNLTTIPQLDTSNVKYMDSTFAYCLSLTTIPQLNTSNVTNINYMFQNCYLLPKIDITSMDKITSSNSSKGTFFNCYNLTKLIIRTMTSIPVLNSNAFTNCYHFSGTINETYNPQGLKDGRIYVPDGMVNSLKQETNWSVYADIIVPLSTLVE